MITTKINGKTFEIDGQDFLSPAEERALEDWLHDMRVQDAARKRFRSPETISTHRKHLREKTNQHTAAGVLAYCLSKAYIRVLVFAGFAVAAEPIIQSTSPAQAIRVVARFSRNTRLSNAGRSGGLQS